jgi:hypothetical protein
MELLGEVGYVEPRFGPFGDSVVSVQDRCMVCVKCTVGSEIVMEATCCTPRNKAQVEAQKSSEIILDAPDGTPR